MVGMRGASLVLLVGSAGVMLGFLGCDVAETEQDDAEQLRRAFPHHAEEVLEASAELASPWRAVPAGGFALTTRHGLQVALPGDGEGDVRFTLADGRTVRVREDGTHGAAAPARAAVAYARDGGASFWSPTGAGVEEWLHLDPAAVVRGRPVATWTVEGARLQTSGAAVVVLGEDGRPMLRVTAPVAYGDGGREVALDLEVQGDRIALFADADHERLLVDPLWAPADALQLARKGHIAALLPSGEVLIAGGRDDTNALTNTTEIYDPGADTWVFTASMQSAIVDHAAALLQDGTVLVSGGFNGDDNGTARIFSGGSWTPVTSMNQVRARHTLTTLPDGRVLAFGHNSSDLGEVYDVGGDAWTDTGQSSITARIDHTATLLLDGTVLIAGGNRFDPGPLDVAEIFDPSDLSFTVTTSMGQPRRYHTATLLEDGRVLVVGGDPLGQTSAEIFDPGGAGVGDDTWTDVVDTLSVGRVKHTATRLLDGKVMIAGGTPAGGASTVATAAVEVFDPSDESFTDDTAMGVARSIHTATLLEDGNVLVAGGQDGGTALGTSELYLAGLPLGAPCIDGTECGSTFCSDGVCCGIACTDECDACSVTAGAAADGQCSALDGDPCTGGTCVLGTCDPDPLPDGSSCFEGGDCINGNCVFGICCDVPCFGQCNSCSVQTGATVDGTCAALDLVACSDEGITYCDQGSCVSKNDDGTACADPIECLSGNCADGFCCNTPCFGECGACSVAQGASADGTCTAQDGDACTAGDLAGICNGFECTPIPPKALGEACTIGTECESDFCADGVCCTNACAGPCDACSEALGAESDGFCQILTPGTACDDGDLCTEGDTCIGKGICESGDEVVCEPAECQVSGSCVQGECQFVDEEDGTPCSRGVCLNGACGPEPFLENGEPCAESAECGSRQCVDGVCCDSACEGACEACSVEAGGSEDGTCGGTTGETCDDGDACTQVDACAAGSCVGSDPVECEVSVCQLSNTCSGGVCVAVSKLDGAPCEGGTCIAGSCTADPEGNLSGSASGTGSGQGSGPGGTGSATGAGAGSGSGNGSGNGSGTGSDTGSGNGSGDGDGEGGGSDGAEGGESDCAMAPAQRPGGAAPVAALGLLLAIAAHRRRGARAGGKRRIA
jgi:hypothetical protein